MQYGDEIAVTDSEKKITYLELNQKAICIGQYFMEKGMEHIMQHGVGKNISYRFFMLMDIMFML